MLNNSKTYVKIVQEEEKTQTIYGVENTVPLSLSYFARAKQSHDSCGDFTLASVIMTTEPIRNAYLQLLKSLQNIILHALGWGKIMSNQYRL